MEFEDAGQKTSVLRNYIHRPNCSGRRGRVTVKEEMQGPGKLLGYRALHKKLRQVHDLNVPRDLVHAVMYNVDPDALAERFPQYKKKTAKSNFASRGPNWVHSLDSHDKLRAIKTALSLSQFMDAWTLAAEKCFGQRFGSAIAIQM